MYVPFQEDCATFLAPIQKLPSSQLFGGNFHVEWNTRRKIDGPTHKKEKKQEKNEIIHIEDEGEKKGEERSRIRHIKMM